MMMQVNCGNYVFLFDAVMLANSYGAHALRCNLDGTIEAFIVTPDGGEWESIEDATLVEMAGRPAKPAKKN